MNASTSFRKNAKLEKAKSSHNNKLQTYRYMMNNNNYNEIVHYINNNDIPLINQVSYHHSTLPSFPLFSPSPYYIQWVSPMNNNDIHHHQYTNEHNNNNNNIMVDQLSLNGIYQQYQQHQVNNTIESKKMESNKKDVNGLTEISASQKRSSLSNFKFNTKAAEFKPNHHYHHILLNTSVSLFYISFCNKIK